MGDRNASEWPPQTDQMQKAFTEIYSSGDWWKYTGERVIRLEREFPRSHDCRFGVSICNGSVAIDIALKALGIKPKDEVILPAYDFYSLPKSVLNVGAVPVFVDVDPNNFTIDANAVKKKIGPLTKAIVAVHISGSVAELDALKKSAKENNSYLIEDCAQAHGAVYQGRKVGSWGDLAVFSFGGIKLMTSGQGGMITTSDEELYKRCYAITNRGQLPDGKVNRFGIIGENFQMSELQAAVLLPQIDLLESYSQRREEAFCLLDQEFSQMEGIKTLTQFPKTERRAHMRYSFCYQTRLSEKLPRSQLISQINGAGIPAIAGYSSAPTDPRLQKAFHQLGEEFPNSKAAQEQIVGIHHTFLLKPQATLADLAELMRENLARL
jgi:dTDP-4-amino-4,6-dideoxygalactose transaminase